MDILFKGFTERLADFFLMVWAFGSEGTRWFMNRLLYLLSKLSPPPEDSFKLNIDGALFFDLNKASMDDVLRNHMGEVLMAVSRVETVFLELEQVEVGALLRGLQLCMSLGIPKLIIESDCLFLVEEVNRSSESNAAIRSVVANVKSLMQTFPQCSIQYNNRFTNEAAHRLARHAWSIEDMFIWWNNVPPIIEN
ncbi:hypothetical protein F2P56_024300, partial [Juglans regia]